MHPYVVANTEHWHKEVGYSGLIMCGGLDAEDKPTAFMWVNPSKRRVHSLTFQLARRLVDRNRGRTF